MKKILSIFAVLALATACIYPYQPDFENENGPDNVLVVDGSLLIGELSTVKIGFMYDMWPKKSDDEYKDEGYVFYTKAAPYNDIRVWAEDDGGGVYEGTLDMGDMTSFYYYSPNTPYVIHTEHAPTDRSYRVCVRVGELLYTSDWIKPLAPPVLKNISFKASKPNEKADVTVSVSLDGGSDATGYVLLSFDETWQFHAQWYPNFDYDPRRNAVEERLFPWEHYWCWKSVDPGTQIPVDFTGMATSSLKNYPFHSFSRYDNRNHKRYSIRVKARTIDKETYLYLRHLEENTDIGGSLFSPNPGEIIGNLRCETDPDRMVLGFVTVARLATMRAYIGSNYLISRVLSPYELAYPRAYPQGQGDLGWADYYQMGYMPVEENSLPDPDPNFGPYGWASAPCYDCIAAGGTQVRPDFWEE